MKSNSTATTPETYIANVPDDRRQSIQQLHDLIRTTLPKLIPYMQSGMIGYGKFHYKYASGREGDWPLIALANQKQYISLYVCAAGPDGYLAELYANRLGRVSVGRSCVRFKQFSDLDEGTVRDFLREAEKIGAAGWTAM